MRENEKNLVQQMKSPKWMIEKLEGIEGICGCYVRLSEKRIERS